MTRRPEIIAVDAESPDDEVIAYAAGIIRGGGLVAMPTETVYGLAGSALDPASIARIYEAKGRPRHNPLIAHVASLPQARELASEWPMMADELASRFWPGPLTLVLRRKAIVPDALTAGLDTFGARVPDHAVALALISACGFPLAAPSANRFTEVSPVTALQVARGLGKSVDLILDAGRTRVGIESTVVDVSGGRPVILRPGMISRTTVEAVVGPTGRPSPVKREDEARPAPGMIARHYAPRAQVVLFERGQFDDIQRDVATRLAATEKLAMILCTLSQPRDLAVQVFFGLGEDAAEYAAHLYDAFHAADESGCSTLYVERPPLTPEWDAIHDRLRRAAHPE